MFDLLRYGLLGLYLLLLLMVVTFGIHRLVLVYLYYKYRSKGPCYQDRFSELPNVTIQLPMFNEPFVAERVIKNCCQIDYPEDKLQIQILDDSTDDTARIVSSVVKGLATKGHNIVRIHRDNRHGFKAGALENGLKTATGEFIAIFDADFVPRPDIIQKTIHYFSNEKVGMVQVRWGHINRNHSLLTRTQAILLDAHFIIEHTARNRSKRFMNFNGTAGIWRRRCIEQSGGWQHDTLTEDLDLSYRCQMKDWQFVYLPDITAPAELPPEIQGFKGQQFRWTKGAIQTGKKILPQLLRSSLPWKIKLEAVFHLISPMNYLFISILILLLPVFRLHLLGFDKGLYYPPLIDFVLLVFGTCSTAIFYMCSQHKISSNWIGGIKYLPFLMALGVGIALNNSRGVLEAIFGKESDFERTPKYGMQADEDKHSWMAKTKGFARRNYFMAFIELAYGVYLSFCINLCLQQGMTAYFLLPFLVVFAIGYYYVGILTIYSTCFSLGK